MRRISFALIIFASTISFGCSDESGGASASSPACPTGDTCVAADAGVADSGEGDSATVDAGPGIDPVAHQACVNRACGANNCGDPGVLCDGEAVACGTCTGDNLCAGNTADEGTSKAGKCNDDCLSTKTIDDGACGTTTFPEAAWGVVATCGFAPYVVEADGGIEVRPLGVGGTKYTTMVGGINYNCWAN